MISIIIGTNRSNAKSKEMAAFYQNLLNKKEVANQIVDLEDLPTDFVFSALYQHTGKNEGFNALRKKMDEAQKYIFIVPEYNNSFPGVLKAFIDGLSYPNGLVHKKCALVGVSDGIQGNVIGLSHLTDIFNYLGMHVLAQKVRIPLMKKNFVDGKIQDDFINKLIEEQIELLIKF
jgi:chromate reductase, NAD(P)H dehydrogenase (quinone)